MSNSANRWYSASVILVFKLKRRKQANLPVWENVYLIKADSVAAARKRAEALGRAEASQEGLELNGKPARLVFGGVRKVISCAADPALPGDSTVTSIHDGVEATFSSFLVKKADLKKLIRGDAVKVLYEE